MSQDRIANLSSRLYSRTVSIGIFGAGYVGLPLACAFAEAGFKTFAGDTSQEKLEKILRGQSYVEDEYVTATLPGLVTSGALTVEQDAARLASTVDFAVIAVPTPLNERREPDLTHVVNVVGTIASGLKPGKFVILESSVYPGTTEEIVKPILEQSGLKAGLDFGLAFSPERVDYGNPRWNIKNTPKVVGGVSPLCTHVASELYRIALQTQVVPVSCTRVAEATKMLENTYRYVSIALVNELSILHEKLGIDFLEVVAAAATKPFGFEAFYPGPGVGGHCIPKDPHYLLYKARQMGHSLALIETSAIINDGMVDHITGRLENRFRSRGRSLHGSRAALLGLAFKANVSDTRNSPSIAMAERLMRLGVEVTVYDPFADHVMVMNRKLESARSLEIAVSRADILVLMTPHEVFREIELEKLHDQVNRGAIVLDTRGFWSPRMCEDAGFEYIGIGRPDSRPNETGNKCD